MAGRNRFEGKTFLAVTRHRIPGRFEQALDRRHEGGRTAGVDIALQEIRHDVRQASRVHATEVPGISAAGRVVFAHHGQTQLWHVTGHQTELICKKQIKWRAGTVDKDNIGLAAQVVQRTQHGHQGCDTAAPGDEQVARGRCLKAAEQAGGSHHTHRHADLQVVVQPVGDHTAGHPLDGDADAVGSRGCAGKGVATVDPFATDLQLQRDELTRQVSELAWGIGRQHKGFDVVCFLADVHAAQALVGVR